ncbi:MAG: MurR/RpiR family transcriptional regulator [Rhizobiaceae bacterium]
MQLAMDQLTRAERQLANSLLENWPVSALGSITAVAQNAEVSTPTVTRLVHKLGFKGFPAFQRAMREELEATISGPIEKHDRWATDAPDTHNLNRFADAVLQNMRQTLSHIDPAEFDLVCSKLADLDRAVYIAGGRITHTVAEYLFLHMQMIRPDVILLPATENGWPHHLLNIRRGDVLVLLDIRRYQNDLLKLAEIVAEKGAEIVLFTDQWGSPVTRHSTHHFNSRVEVPSAWDSSASLLILIETLIAQIQSLTWKSASGRMKELEAMFDRTRLFRKFK